jgi:hypothetical protein
MDRETAKVEEEILEEVIRRDEAEIERDKKEVAEFRHKLEELKDSRRVEVIIGATPTRCIMESTRPSKNSWLKP